MIENSIDTVDITIDGKKIKANKNTNILQAAMDAGMYIPYLCYYPGMKSYGACRMCVVEVEGGRGVPASCTTPVADGMKINTQTDELVDLRKGIMELLLSEHPHGCLTCHRIDLCGPSDICLRHVSVNDRCITCPKNERCELKDTVRSLDMEMNSPLTYNYRGEHVKNDDPLWDMDMNLCIVCARCVRVCSEVRVDNALTVKERAGKVIIGTSMGDSLIDAGCEYDEYCSDITRTFPCNGQFTRNQQALYEAVLDTQMQTIQQVKPGTTFKDLNTFAQTVISEHLIGLNLITGSLEQCLEQKSYLEYLPHGIGHTMGLDVHDIVHDELEAGMVLTIEPGLYLQNNDAYGHIGIRIEDNLLVTTDGHEVLTSNAVKSIDEIQHVMKEGA